MNNSFKKGYKYWSWRPWVRLFAPVSLLLWYSKRTFGRAHVWFQDHECQLELRPRFKNEPARTCYICLIGIQDAQAIVRDHHLCSECHALTRDLAKRRRKEHIARRKLAKASI